MTGVQTCALPIFYDLYINRPTESDVGLFGAVGGEINHLGLERVQITGGDHVAGISAEGGRILNSYVKGNINGVDHVEIGRASCRERV